MKLYTKKKTIISLSLIAGILIVIAICSCTTKKSSDFITVIDMEGTQVTLNKNINRVACISPSATNLMIAFGLGEKIVGTYRSFLYNSWVYELYPPARKFKEYSYSISAEELLKDEIDLVILQNTENADSFRNAGIPVVAVHQYSSTGPFDDEVYEVAELIGEIFGNPAQQQADKWIQDVKASISEIHSKIGSQNTERSIYYVNGEKEKGLFYSDGGNSMISRILEIANVRLATEKYGVLNVHKVSDEEMVSLNPFAMLIGGAYQNNLIDELNTSDIWSLLDCNKQGRIYRIPVAMVGIENVCAETPVMLRYVASLFNETYHFDLQQELKKNIKKYFGCDLSDDDIKNMCLGLDKNGKSMVNPKN